MPEQELTALPALPHFLSTLLLLFKNHEMKTTFQIIFFSIRAGLEWFSAEAGLLLRQVKETYFGVQLNHLCSSSQIISQYYPVGTLIAQHLSLCPCVSDR
jgi:hypothetical protein